jgi:hypothetical protein
MTVPSVPCRIADPAPPGEGPQVTPGRIAELPSGQCTRCGAVGTHYLTCPSLRLPAGHRLGGAPRLEGWGEMPGEGRILAGHRTDDYFVSLYDYMLCRRTERGTQCLTPGPEGPAWPASSRHGDRCQPCRGCVRRSSRPAFPPRPKFLPNGPWLSAARPAIARPA